MIFEVEIWHQAKFGNGRDIKKIDAPNQRELEEALRLKFRNPGPLPKHHSLANCNFCGPSYTHHHAVLSTVKPDTVLQNGEFS